MNSGWSLLAYTGKTGLEAIRGEWLALVESDPASTYLQHPDWITSYVETLARNTSQIHFLCAKKNGRLRAVLPVESTGKRPWPWPATYRLISGPHMHLCDLCVAAHDTEARDVFFQLLLNKSPMGWTRLHLQSVHDHSALSRAMNHPQVRTSLLTTKLGKTTWLDCSLGVNECLERASKSFKQNLRRLARRANSMGHLAFEVVTCPHRMEWALQEFLSIEGSGWKTQAGTDIARDPRLVAFYRALSQRFASRGSCRIHLLTLNGQTIAGQFGLVSARQLNLLKIGYDADFSAIAPGNLIMQHAVEAACSDPALDRLSFVTNPPWAHLWKPHLVGTHDVVLFHPGTVGQVTLAGTQWWRSRRQQSRSNSGAPADEAVACHEDTLHSNRA